MSMPVPGEMFFEETPKGLESFYRIYTIFTKVDITVPINSFVFSFEN